MATPGMPLLVAALGLTAVAGCASEVHPEFHPETSYRYTQNISFPTQTVVVSLPAECPAGSDLVNGACRFRDAACPAGSRRVGTACVVETVRCPAGTRWGEAGTCVALVDPTCPGGFHFAAERGCVADIPPYVTDEEARRVADEDARRGAGARRDDAPSVSPWKIPCGSNEPKDTGCAGGIIGLRGAVVDVGGGVAGHASGFQLATDEEWFLRNGNVSGLLRYRAGLGVGTAGFEGMFTLAPAVGYRLPVTENHGPIARAGIDFDVVGNDVFYASKLEPAQLQLGWQWTEGHTLVEATATSSLLVAGAFGGANSALRSLGVGLAYGGRLSVQSSAARLSLLAERLPANEGDPVDTATATACLWTQPSVCLDGRAVQAHVRTRTDTRSDPFVRVLYAGLTLGLTLH